jgi:hypothetical protein
MGNSYRTASTGFITPIDPFTLFLIFLGFIGVFATQFQKIEAATIYFNFTLGAFALVAMALIFQSVKRPKFEKVFTSDIDMGIFYFYIGALIVVIFNLISSLKSYMIVRPFALFSLDPTTVGHTFSVVKIQTDAFWQMFYSVIAAGSLEEVLFSYFAIIIGILLIAPFVKKFFGIGDVLGSIFGQTGADFVIAAAFSIATFTLAHVLNQTYTLSEAFIFAALFRTAMLILLYNMNWGISAAIGFHYFNNAFAIGLDKTFAGLTTGFGWFFLGLLIVTIFMFVKNFPTTFKKAWGVKIGL